MKNKNYLSAMAGIDEDLIARSERKSSVNTTSKRITFKRVWIPIAACLLVAVLAVGFYTSEVTGNPVKPMIISNYNGGYSTSYIPPEPGKYYCFYDVDKARKENIDKNVDYLLAFDLFKGGGNILTESEKNTEHQRLIDAGYRLYKTTYWTYEGEGAKVEQSVVVGLFSEEELASFNANPAYGYAFHFVQNGDGSAITVNEDNLLR